MAGDPTDPTWLYVTTSRVFAKAFAAYWRHPATGPHVAGDLYRVRPLGTLADDPDYAHEPGLSHCCRGAVIIAVEQRAIRLTRELELAAHRYNAWDDGSRMYDESGYILPCQAMLDVGVTADDLRDLGLFPDVWAANRLATGLARSRGTLPPPGQVRADCSNVSGEV